MPGKFHGQRSQAGYSPWSHRVGHDLVCVRVHTHTHTQRQEKPESEKMEEKWKTEKQRQRQEGGRIRSGRWENKSGGKKKP